jgi:methylenetetrahydrofolate reductase (NADPH)
MKVTEHLDRADKPLISFEIIPPLRGGNVSGLLNLIEDLARYDPPFIDITSHGSQVSYEETEAGIQRKVKRKRPGTIGVCALIQNKYNIDAVPHVLCLGFTREESEDFLIELNYLGIDNVLMNRGRYLEEGILDADPTDFCIGIAGYPEKHFEAPNLETDVSRTKEKVDTGGDYIVTQMFFDNQRFDSYVDDCRKAGIEVPIIPGLKIITTKQQLRTLPSKFHCDIPPELANEIEAAKPEHVMEVGVEWALKQAADLLDNGVPSLHFYLMQSSKPIKLLLGRLKP